MIRLTSVFFLLLLWKSSHPSRPSCNSPFLSGFSRLCNQYHHPAFVRSMPLLLSLNINLILLSVEFCRRRKGLEQVEGVEKGRQIGSQQLVSLGKTLRRSPASKTCTNCPVTIWLGGLTHDNPKPMTHCFIIVKLFEESNHNQHQLHSSGVSNNYIRAWKYFGESVGCIDSLKSVYMRSHIESGDCFVNTNPCKENG